MAQRSILSAPPIVAIAGWVLPGLGYALIGQKVRAMVVGVAVIVMFLSGILIAGIRVIDVPGYDNNGFAVRVRTIAQAQAQRRNDVGAKIDPYDPTYPAGDLSITSKPLAEIVNKPWYVGQVLTGPICVIASKLSIEAAQPANPQTAAASRFNRTPKVPTSHARVAEIGSLYTAIAGMLNLLAIIDSASRASRAMEEAA